MKFSIVKTYIKEVLVLGLLTVVEQKLLEVYSYDTLIVPSGK